MKTLLIIRHAKAEQSHTLNDFERSLNERGKKDVPLMAQRLTERNIAIDLFVASPAKRTKQTAQLFCQTLKKSEAQLVLVSALYQAPPSVFYEVIRQLEDKHNTVAIIAHNPGVTYFANELTPQSISDMPTCGIFAVTINASTWKEFLTAKKEFLFFDYPKNS